MSKRTISKSINKYANDILKQKSFLMTAENVQHGSFSVKQHSIHVAKSSLILARYLPVRISEKELVRGALLHDYFLYDWHQNEVSIKTCLKFYKMHGFVHPSIAAVNANKDFTLSNIENDIIKKHMWPLTIIPPLCREAWIVNIADKYCSLYETIFRNKGDLCG